jgi:hypothetical protein
MGAAVLPVTAVPLDSGPFFLAPYESFSHSLLR